MNQSTPRFRSPISPSTRTAAALLGVVLGCASLPGLATAQDGPCPQPAFDPTDPFPEPGVWTAYVEVTTAAQFGGASVRRYGSGFIVSPHALLLPASMLHQRGGLPNPSGLKIDEWIGSLSEYTITPDARIVEDSPHTSVVIAPYGSRVPSGRLVSSNYLTTTRTSDARVRYNWGALKYDCPFEGLGTGMAVTFSKKALNKGRATIGGYKVLNPWTRFTVPAEHSLDARDIKDSGSKWKLKAKNQVNLTKMISGAGAWKTYVSFETGEIEFDYGLLGLFTWALMFSDDACKARGPRFCDVASRADTIREIMNWTPDQPCDSMNPMSWNQLKLHVLEQQPEMLLPSEQLNLVEHFDGDPEEYASHTMQVIEHTFYEWYVYQQHPDDPMSPRALRMVAPEQRWLTPEEGQALLSASINWVNVNPPAANPTETEIDLTISADTTMAMGEEIIEDDEDADEDVIEFLVEGPVDGGSPFDPADLNEDGSVDGADLAMLLSAWGTQGGPADLNGNGFVEGADLAVLLSHWQ